MADRYWVNDAVNGDWNNANNWSATDGGSGGAGVPTSSDAVYFTVASSNDNCSLSAAAACASITSNTDYTGTLDAAGFDVAVGGNVVFSITGSSVLMGEGTWTVGGNFQIGNTVAANTICVPETSTLVMTGTSKTVYHYMTLYNLTIAAGASISPAYNLRPITGDLVVDGTLSTDYPIQASAAGKTVTVNGTGVVSGIANLTCRVIANAGTVSSPLVVTAISGSGSAQISGVGTFSGNVTLNAQSAQTLTIGSDLTFGGPVTFTCNFSTGIISNAGNWNLTFQGGVTVGGAGTLTYTKGTGTITLSGSADQSIDFLYKTVEDIVINKSTTAAKVTFTNGWTSDSFTLTQGTLAFDSTGATLETTGNFTIGTNGQVDPTNLDGWTWTVGGDLSLSGESGDLLDLVATGTWYLQTTGSASATYVDVDYSDASGYTEVDASDGTSTDEGNNSGWDFGGAATDLTANDATHAHAADSPAIDQVQALAADDATHAHDCDSSAITQFHALMGDDCAHAHAVDSPALTQLHKMVA
ncbi:MAG TPA: hypothetical protein VM223_23100, partial [Planctomycetota bacterium]|nr:hypothetical protein [Planctomycetota bacterium]